MTTCATCGGDRFLDRSDGDDDFGDYIDCPDCPPLHPVSKPPTCDFCSRYPARLCTIHAPNAAVSKPPGEPVATPPLNVELQPITHDAGARPGSALPLPLPLPGPPELDWYRCPSCGWSGTENTLTRKMSADICPNCDTVVINRDGGPLHVNRIPPTEDVAALRRDLAEARTALACDRAILKGRTEEMNKAHAALASVRAENQQLIAAAKHWEAEALDARAALASTREALTVMTAARDLQLPAMDAVGRKLLEARARLAVTVGALEHVAANGCCFEDTYGSCAAARAAEDGEAGEDCDGCIARAALAPTGAPPAKETT